MRLDFIAKIFSPPPQADPSPTFSTHPTGQIIIKTGTKKEYFTPGQLIWLSRSEHVTEAKRAVYIAALQYSEDHP